jgi:hypothetical protein
MSLAEAVTNGKLAIPNLEFPHDPSAEEQCEHRLLEHGMEQFVLLNPGAGWGAKQWPAERYGEVAHRLAEWGYGSLVNFGPGEGVLARAVEATSEGAAEGISCSLSLLIALTRRARLFIGGDTGPMHLAAALGVPIVGLFGPTNPARNGPFGTRTVVLRSESSVTSHSRRKDPERGLLEITPDQVLVAAKQLLGTPRAPHPRATWIRICSSLCMVSETEPAFNVGGLASGGSGPSRSCACLRSRAKKRTTHYFGPLCLYEKSAIPWIVDLGSGLRRGFTKLVDCRGHDFDVCSYLRPGHPIGRNISAEPISWLR